jgi:hypothetical protein
MLYDTNERMTSGPIEDIVDPKDVERVGDVSFRRCFFTCSNIAVGLNGTEEIISDIGGLPINVNNATFLDTVKRYLLTNGFYLARRDYNPKTRNFGIFGPQVNAILNRKRGSS